MKIAGRKNDGAWFRTNKAIMSLDGDEKGTLIAAMSEALGLKAEAFIADVQALAAECGLTIPPAFQTDETALHTSFVDNGIPRQVWWGKLTFTTTSRTGEPLAYEYHTNYQNNIRYYAKDLRRFMKYYIAGLRELADLGNEATHNPGKLPNVDRLT